MFFFYFNLFRMNFSSNSGDSNWIDNNLSKRGNNFLCRVDEAFIADNFNLYGLTSLSNGADFYRVNKKTPAYIVIRVFRL